MEIIERETSLGQYDMRCEQMIVSMDDGRTIYMTEGFGGMDSLSGGMYRWRHGMAVEIKAGDTLESLRDMADGYNCTVLERATRGGDDPDRKLLEWSGSYIDGLANKLKRAATA